MPSARDSAAAAQSTNRVKSSDQVGSSMRSYQSPKLVLVRAAAAARRVLLPRDVERVELARLAGDGGEKHDELLHQEQVARIAVPHRLEVAAQQIGAVHGVEDVVGAAATLAQALPGGIGDIGRELAAAFPVDASP